MMAIKEININKISSQKDNVVQSFKNEIDVLSKLHHKNIIKYYGAYEKGDKLNILLEYCIAGSLYKLLEVYHHFKENIIRKFTFQILKGIEYLHSHNIIHRDIKCANILIDRDGICKLSDFGDAKIIRDPHDIQKNPIQGTPNWMAPEIIKKGEATRFSDIWSIGCTIIEMYQGKPPWSNYYTPLSVMNCIYHAKKPPDIPTEASPEMKDFLSKCLQMEPSKRWNVNQLINHPFIKKLPQNIRDAYDENDELLQNGYFLDRNLIYAPMKFNIEDKNEIQKQCRYRGSKFKSENYDTRAPRTMNSMIQLESV